MTLIKFLSLNVRGLRNHVKRRALFSYLKNQKADFYCLQETFSLKRDEVSWATEWGGKVFFSHGTEHSKGTCILQRPNSLFTSSVQFIDPDGRLVIVKTREGDEDLFLASVYNVLPYALYKQNKFQLLAFPLTDNHVHSKYSELSFLRHTALSTK